MAKTPMTETDAHSFLNDCVSILSLLALRSPGGVLAITRKELEDADGLQMEATNDGTTITFKVLKREGTQ